MNNSHRRRMQVSILYKYHISQIDEETEEVVDVCVDPL